MENILITGGTGLIGKHLTKMLIDNGYSVALLGRKINKTGDLQTWFWDIENNTVDAGALDSADYIIHLAGAGIGDKRWSKRRKKEIRDSRIRSAQLIFDQVMQGKRRVKAFLSASAIGYYGGTTSEKIFSETDPPAADFLGETCRLWEEAADRFRNAGIRTVKIRTGVVLTPKGGALSKLALPVKMGIGSHLGNGSQYMPWIHIEDLCGIYLKALKDQSVQGSYNAVAPEHITNRQLMKAIAGVLHKPMWFPPVPAFALRLLFGEMASLFLSGSRVSCNQITRTGYAFKYSRLKDALGNLLGNSLQLTRRD
ncbi:MAG: TIGR01777 family oxidoreductase [Bacteroidales bacterium]